MKFSQLSKYFEKIENTSSRLEMTQLLSDLFKEISEEEIDKVLYLLQGRICPLYESIDFGIGERTLIKAIIAGLNVERKFFLDKYGEFGDIGKTVEYFRKKVITIEEKDTDITEVFNILNQIAYSSGDGSQEIKISLIIQLIRMLDPLSTKYLIRIPINNLRLGFSDMTILDAFSWMLKGDKSERVNIEKKYHVLPDLGLIGKKLKQKGILGINEINPQIFTPIIMMRAERLTNSIEIIEKIGECSIESKYDGFRLQIHYDKNSNEQVRMFSRNLEEVTNMYPDLKRAVLSQIKVDKIIFEGEAIGFNPQTGDFLPFQETVQRKRKYDIEEKAKEIPLKLFAFDVLYINGESLLDVKFIERRKKLTNSFKKTNDNFVDNVIIAEDKIVNNEKEINLLFEQAVEKGLEGIMAKKLDGIYQAGARGWNWIKLKKSYSIKLQDTIDCLVMGYDLGKGKRTEFGIGAFLVGIYDEENDQYLTVAKIGTGLSDVEWKTLKKEADKYKSDKKPIIYNSNKEAEVDVWIKPQLVVEIRADEITKSPVHSAGLALRFPRLERFRDDKKPEEITSLKEVVNIFKSQSQ